MTGRSIPLGLTADLTVDSSGFHKLRSGSDMEDHMYNPLTILTLQQAVRTGDFDCFRSYSAHGRRRAAAAYAARSARLPLR